ncbi:MAG TPA: protein kinase [Polyangia bacterium]
MSESGSDTQGSGPKGFGRFRVVKLLGAGGMGEVFLARDDLLGREVAIKTLCIPGLGAAAAKEFEARFLNEARAIAALSHPNVVRMFDLGFDGATPYLVMEVVGGPSLRERLKGGGRLTAGEVRALGIQIGGALKAAHEQGIVHRDVKPGNVLAAEPGIWKLADFGVARVPDSSLTMTGQFLGSPAYAAPEALLLGQFGPASDVYGLGATLYEALAGESPFGDPGQISLAAIASQEPPPPIAARCPGVPADVARVITAALAREPRARPTATELVDELAGLEGGPRPAPRPALALDQTRAAVPSALQAAPVAPAALATAAPVAPAALATAATVAVPSLAAVPLPRPAPAAAPAGSIVIAPAVVAGPPPAGATMPVAATAPPAAPFVAAATRFPPAAAPPPGAAAARRPMSLRLVLLGAGAVLLLGVGLGLGMTFGSGREPARPAAVVPQRDAGAAARPAPPDAAAAAVQRDAAPSPADLRRARAQQWTRIHRSLAEGNIEQGRKDLEDYAKRYPDDENAEQLLEHLRSWSPGRPGGFQGAPDED